MSAVYKQNTVDVLIVHYYSVEVMDYGGRIGIGLGRNQLIRHGGGQISILRILDSYLKFLVYSPIEKLLPHTE